MEKGHLDTDIKSFTKINSKQNIDLNITFKTITVPETNTRKKHDSGFNDEL